MKKKVLTTALALTIAGMGLAGVVMNGKVSAATPNKVSQVVTKEKGEDVALNQATKFSKEQSIELALKEVKGTVKSTELEDEDGIIVYGVHIQDPKGKQFDIKVDANKGKVIKADQDNDNESGQEEGAKN